MWDVCTHAVEEFFSMGKYLVLGALIAAAVQTFVQTSTLLAIGQGPFSSPAVMMGLAYILSLCSEADAFIALIPKYIFNSITCRVPRIWTDGGY